MAGFRGSLRQAGRLLWLLVHAFPAGAGGAPRQRPRAQQGAHQGAHRWPDRRRACWPSRTARRSAGCRSDRAPTCPNGTMRAGARRRSIRPMPQDPGRLGDLLLLHPHQGARQGAHAPAGRRGGIEFARQNGARWSRPVRSTCRSNSAFDRAVRRLDAGVRESRVRAGSWSARRAGR